MLGNLPIFLERLINLFLFFLCVTGVSKVLCDVLKLPIGNIILYE